MTFQEEPAARFIRLLEDLVTKHQKYVSINRVDQIDANSMIMTSLRSRNSKAVIHVLNYISKLVDVLRVTVEVKNIPQQLHKFYVNAGFRTVNGSFIRSPSL